MFKNASILKLPAGYALTEIESALSVHPLRSPGPLEMATRGFVSPFSRPDGALSHESSRCTLLALGKNERLLPASILQAEMAERIADHEAKNGRKPGKRMRNEIRELALGELLPRAFVKHSRTLAYYDADAALLIVDSASDRAGEDACTAIREALGSFPARPLATEASIALLLTEWLISGNLPDGFALGEGCELKDPTDTASVVRCRNHDLTAEEIREHARCGNQVTQLALVFDQRIGFTLDSRCRLRKLEFFDVVADKLADQEFDDPAARVDAEFTLMALELRDLFTRLDEILRFESTAPVGEQRGAIGDLLDSVNRSGMTVTISTGDSEIVLGNGERKVVQKAARDLDDLLRQDGASATLTDSAGNVLAEFGDADSCPATAVEG